MGRVKVRKPHRPRGVPQVTASISPHAVFSWASQAMQYPQRGAPGIAHRVEYNGGDEAHESPIDCLLYYSDGGQLIGILNHYRCDMPPWEKAGNINIWVHPDAQRMGVGRALVAEADRRFTIDFDQQRFTPSGVALARAYLAGRS